MTLRRNAPIVDPVNGLAAREFAGQFDDLENRVAALEAQMALVVAVLDALIGNTDWRT